LVVVQQVFVAQHPTEAHFIRGLLEAAGIHALVRGESLFSVRGETPATVDTLPSVWVGDDEADRAREVIDQRRGAATDDADGPWTCPQCGEQVEAQFTECWRCGASRGAG
jgi:hypothetical protein